MAAAVLQALDDRGLTAHDLLIYVLESRDDSVCTRNLERASNPSKDLTRRLLNALLSHPRTTSVAESWAKEAVLQFARREVQSLTAAESRLRFNAKTVCAADITGFDIEAYSHRLLELAPFTWSFCDTLLDANGFHRMRLDRAHAAAATSGTSAIASAGDVSTELGVADLLLDDLTAEELADFPDQPPATSDSRDSRALTRSAALRRNKSVAILSIFMQSSHYQCLKLAAVLGFNMQSRLTPEVVIEMYAHLGLSVSPSTLVNMTKALSLESWSEVVQAADRMRMQMAYDNQDIGNPAAQPTVEKSGGFLSITSATYLLVRHCHPDDLKYSHQLWEKSILNPSRPPGSPAPYRMSFKDIVMLLPLSPTTHLPAHFARFSDQILRNLVAHNPAFSYYRPNLRVRPRGTEDLLEIPVVRTEQYPARTMPFNAGKVDDQWNILSTLLKNAGYGEEKHTILDKYCILVHGDLGMLEKVTSLQSSRAIEESAYTRLQWVVGIPGLFHTRMACAEAVWRTHIKPASGRTDNPLSIWHLAALLRPRETGKLSGKPTFRLLHDVITHLTRALLLVCWERVIPARFSSLEDFAKSRPTWDELVALSERIAQEFVAGDDLSDIRRRGDNHRDGTREDISLFLREGLLYDDLGHATTYGHIGRVEENLAHWIPIFAAVGKHKYATALARFLTNLRHVYPPPMSRAIRLNWLCNPTGRADGFRAVDWLVELNNMMQKTWYGGEGSHRTLEHIRRQSVLTELYRSCVVQIEKNFHLTHRTVRHHPPDMTKTLEVVAGHIRAKELLKFIPGRTSPHSIPDQLVAGLAKMQRQYAVLRDQADPEEVDDDEERDTEPDDGDLEVDLEMLLDL